MKMEKVYFDSFNYRPSMIHILHPQNRSGGGGLARRHGGGLHRRDAYRYGGFYHRGEGFHGNEKQLVAEMPVEPATATTVVLPIAEPDPDSRHDAAVAAAEEPVHGEADEEDEDEMASSRTSPEGCLRRPFTCRPMSVSWKITKQELQLHLLSFCCKGNRTAQAQQLVLRL
uniref:Uncharacterized protein n=1 Tax=Oryza rufipogon TaxID=4529 RepID=A0A0E0PDH9_ORYRU